MRRMFCLAVAASCSVIGAMSAQAADVTARPAASSLPSYDKAPEAQPFNWNGFYLGLNGGYAGARSSWSDPAVGADSGTFNGSGGTIGGQLGYNWQLGKVVLGVESDLDWMNVAGSAAGGVCATDGGGLCQTKQSWLGTTRLRAGYAFDNWLPYLTGGLAYGNVQASQPNGTSGNVQAGWTAGAGLEYGFSRDWSAKLEFLHIDLGTATFMGAASGTSTLSVPVTDNLVRAGINYHW